MAQFNISRSRDFLQRFRFEDLFIEELGWNRSPFGGALEVVVDGAGYSGRPIAELAGMMVFEVTGEDGQMPGARTRLAVQQEIARQYHENLLIFLDGERRQSVWYWVKRDGGKRYPRSHHYVAGQSGDLLLSKIGAMFVDMSELDDEGHLPVVKVAQRVKEALDIERVTRKFYDEFKLVHTQFLEAIQGIGDEGERRWYASVILNRLMFIYFLQRKGFVDRRNRTYLQDKLAASQARGADQYYGRFLQVLFFEGFAKPADQRGDEARRLLGEIRYLNGGLFLPHPIELKWPDIAIADAAFAGLFGVFERYSWNLDDTPGGDDDEINPDVLGYIFEKYINQKAFGAYYTRPEITEYLCEQTIHKLVLDRLAELNRPVPGLPAPPSYDSVGEMLLKLDATRARQLLLSENGGVLPGLSLLDPACGSGAFLVAAMKTLLEIYRGVLGRIPALKDKGLRDYLELIDREHPSRDYYLKKLIIANNLFGVDIMAEAVEIARLRLFLALVSSAETEADLEPLPNIDFNILADNSLIGLLRIDEEAYRQYYQPDLFSGPARRYTDIVAEKAAMIQQYRHATEMEGLRHNVDAVQALRDKIEAHRQQNGAILNQLLLDEFQALGIQYEQATWDVKKNRAGKPKKRKLALKDIEALQPFHWGYEFHEVMNERGGFDAVITNPPWETWKPQAKEFFVDYADVVQKNNMRIEEFQKKQAELLQDEEIQSAWLDYLSRFPHQSAYFRSATQYQHQTAVVNGRKTSGDINLYKLFTEQCYNLLHEGGLCGTIIPSGIYTDLSATGLRLMLFEKCTLKVLFGLSNERWLFDGVHHAQKFCVLAFVKGGSTESFRTAFRINPREAIAPDKLDYFLHSDSNHLLMPISLVRRLSPEPLSLMEFNNPIDVQIVRKMLAFPLLGEEVEGAWQLSFTREFDMTNHSHVFRTEACDTCLPLYEGKMIHQFVHDFAPPRYWVEESEGRKVVIGKRSEDTRQLLDYQTYRLSWRDVAAATNERTFIATILPPTFHGNTLPSLRVFDDEENRLIDELTQLFVCAIWNSFVMDWQARQKVTNHLNYFYLYQLAMPRYTQNDPVFNPIVERAARLICTTPEFDDLAAEVGLGDHTAGVTDAAGRAQLRAELDGLIAHVYGLSEEEFRHILSTFPLVEDEVKEAALREFGRFAPDPEIMPLIAGGESATVEFKVAACRNPFTGKNDNSMRDNIVKAVAAFMNNSGGTLLVGVGDDGGVAGVDLEYAVANPSKANWDGYELFLADLLNKSLSLPGAFQYFTITRHTIDGRDVARVQVLPAAEPAYVNSKLYVRAGAQSKELQGPDLISYVQSHWSS